MSWVAAMAMMVAGCGKNDCQKLDDIERDAVKDACKGKSNCTLCECAKDEKKYYDRFSGKCESYTKEELQDSEKCEGAALREARACLGHKECEHDLVGTAQEAVRNACK